MVFNIRNFQNLLFIFNYRYDHPIKNELKLKLSLWDHTNQRLSTDVIINMNNISKQKILCFEINIINYFEFINEKKLINLCIDLIYG